MSRYRYGHLVESLEEGGYVDATPVGPGEEVVHDDDHGRTFTTFEREWVLTDKDGKRELWFENKFTAGHTIVLSTGEELEFARSMP